MGIDHLRLDEAGPRRRLKQARALGWPVRRSRSSSGSSPSLPPNHLQVEEAAIASFRRRRHASVLQEPCRVASETWRRSATAMHVDPI
jgi:hypothetical protein